MPRINWFAVKTLSIFVGGFIFLLGLLTVVSAWTFGGEMEVGRTNVATYSEGEQLVIGFVLLAVGGLMAGVPIFQSFAEVVRVGRRRLKEKEGGSE